MHKPTSKHTQVLVIDENSDTIVHTFTGYIAIECLRSFKYINSHGKVFDGSIHSDFGYHDDDDTSGPGPSIYTAKLGSPTKWFAFPGAVATDEWCSNNCTNIKPYCPKKLCYSVTFDSNDKSTRKQVGDPCTQRISNAYMYENESCEPGLVCSQGTPQQPSPGLPPQQPSPGLPWTCQPVVMEQTDRGLCSWDEYSCWKATAGSANPGCNGRSGSCCHFWLDGRQCDQQDGCLEQEGCDQTPLYICTNNKCNIAPPESVHPGMPLSVCEQTCYP